MEPLSSAYIGIEAGGHGASTSVFSLSLARKNFQRVAVSHSQSKLYRVDNKPLRVVGTLESSVQDNIYSAIVILYVINNNISDGILGLEAIAALGLKLKPQAGVVATIRAHHRATQEGATIAQHISYSVNPLPAIIGCQHRIRLKANAAPTRQPLMSLPLAIRDDVSRELQRLLEAGAIEQVDSSAWIITLVVVEKSDVHIRLCVNLQGPNIQLISEMHLIPTILELQCQLAGKVLTKLDQQQRMRYT